MQTMKRKLAELSATSQRTWPDLLPKALKAVNKTPKAVVHGAAPIKVQKEPEVRFLLQRDAAQAIKHNAKVTRERQEKLEESGAFRAPLPGSTSKFKRGFKATYGEVQRPQSVRGGVVTTADGTTHNLKQIRMVPVDSSGAEARFAENTAGPARKRQKGALILDVLEQALEGEDQISLSRAAVLMRARLRAEGQDYDAVLKQAQAKLIDLIRLDEERFELIETETTGGKPFYYVKLAE